MKRNEFEIAPELVGHALLTCDTTYKYNVNNVFNTADFK
jgi:hypothetical protein